MSTEPASPTEQVVIGNYVLGNPIFAHSSFNFAHFQEKISVKGRLVRSNSAHTSSPTKR